MTIEPNTFYYHFKRDPDQGIEHGAYYILGLGMNTEKRSQHSVILKPLYFCNPRKTDEGGISFQVRPIEFFQGEVDRPEYTGSRFWQITDPKLFHTLNLFPCLSPYIWTNS